MSRHWIQTADTRPNLSVNPTDTKDFLLHTSLSRPALWFSMDTYLHAFTHATCSTHSSTLSDCLQSVSSTVAHARRRGECTPVYSHHSGKGWGLCSSGARERDTKTPTSTASAVLVCSGDVDGSRQRRGLESGTRRETDGHREGQRGVQTLLPWTPSPSFVLVRRGFCSP